MMYHQLPLFDLSLTCPRCGYRFRQPRREALSPVATTILAHVPPRFRAGDVLPVKRVAQLTGYSTAQAQRGLRELAVARCGVRREALGTRKHVYRFQPDSLPTATRT
jgi:hypothetical protein